VRPTHRPQPAFLMMVALSLAIRLLLCLPDGHGLLFANDGQVARPADPRAEAVGGSAAPGTNRQAPVPAQADLIVGSSRGLEAWRPDGSGKRLISAGAARSPRWLDAANVVVIVARDGSEPPDLTAGAALERISLSDGKRQQLALLPPFACKQTTRRPADDRPPPLRLAIQEADDFIIFKGGRRACMSLMDRNINMASVSVDVAIDLTSGKVRRWLTMGSEDCAPPAGVKVAAPDSAPKCIADLSPPPSRGRREAYEFEFASGGVLKRRGKAGARVLKIRGYSPEETVGLSPSGRWSVLRGEQEDGDYIHAQLVLLDREAGEIFPIREGAVWPAALRAGGKGSLPQIKTPIEHTIQVVGETDVRWLGSTAESELLAVGALVVRPGRQSFSVKGEIAR
jgi:hypothetical protein